MGLEETDKEVEPKKKRRYSGLFVKPGTYSKYIDDFIEKEMEAAEITIDEDDVIKEGMNSVPPDTLYTGLINNIDKRDIDNVRVTRDGDDIFLVRTDI